MGMVFGHSLGLNGQRGRCDQGAVARTILGGGTCLCIFVVLLPCISILRCHVIDIARAFLLPALCAAAAAVLVFLVGQKA